MINIKYKLNRNFYFSISYTILCYVLLISNEYKLNDMFSICAYVIALLLIISHLIILKKNNELDKNKIFTLALILEIFILLPIIFNFIFL